MHHNFISTAGVNLQGPSTFQVLNNMDSQTVVVQEAPNQPQQSLTVTLSMPQAGSIGEGRKRTANELDNENDGDPMKRPKIIPEEDVVVVLCESNNGDHGDLVIEGDRVSSPFMGGVKLAVSSTLLWLMDG